jgi:hypothetical protein
MALKMICQDAKKESGERIMIYTPPDPSSPLPGELLRKLAIELVLSCKLNGQTTLGSFGGTGFVVKKPVPPLDKDLAYYYLVTNRHVAECWDESNHPQEVVSIAARLNTKDSGAITLPLGGSDAWRFPVDDSVDLAVMPINPLPHLDLTAISLDSFYATRETMREHRIGEGSPIVVTGYFVQFPGEQRFQPILRHGTLSMIPDELMKTTTGKLGKVYLADVHIFGGNSGSPVLASPEDDVLHSGEHWFIGVVSGYYFETANSRMEIATTVQGETAANSGVAMIVPADEVRNLIENDPVLKGNRDLYLRTVPAQSPSTAGPEQAPPK